MESFKFKYMTHYLIPPHTPLLTNSSSSRNLYFSFSEYLWEAWYSFHRLLTDKAEAIQPK